MGNFIIIFIITSSSLLPAIQFGTGTHITTTTHFYIFFYVYHHYTLPARLFIINFTLSSSSSSLPALQLDGDGVQGPLACVVTGVAGVVVVVAMVVVVVGVRKGTHAPNHLVIQRAQAVQHLLSHHHLN